MQEIIKQIDELTEAMNEKLCEIRNKLGKMAREDKKYEMSAAEAWDLAEYICNESDDVLLNIFGMTDPFSIFVAYTPEQAKCLYDGYFGRHKEEDVIKIGDRVDVIHIDRVRGTSTVVYVDGLFVTEDDMYYYIEKDDSYQTLSFSKHCYVLRKPREE